MLNNFNGSDIFGPNLLNNFISKLNQEFGLYMKIGGIEYTALVSSINTKNYSQDTKIGNIETAAAVLTGRVSSAESKVSTLETNFTNLNSSHDGLNLTVSGISTSLGAVQTELANVKARTGESEVLISDLRGRVEMLESGFSDTSNLTQGQINTALIPIQEDIDYLQESKAEGIHGHAWSDLSNVPLTASRWPTWSEVTDKVEVTTTVPGMMSATDKVKLNGIATGANNYAHPIGDGNLHVPLTGTANNKKVLMAGATAGSLAWNFVSWNDLQDKPSVLLTTDIAAWAKAATKPSYAFSEIGSKPTTVAGYGITDAFEIKSSAATNADGLVLKGSFLIADTEKSYVLVQSTRATGTEITPVTQIKVPTEGTGNPAWRRGSGNPIVWEAWKPLGGISEGASIDYNSTSKSIDFNFTGV